MSHHEEDFYTQEELIEEVRRLRRVAENYVLLRQELDAANKRIELMESHRRAAMEHETKDCKRALAALAGSGICTPVETYGSNTSWAVSDLCRAVKELYAAKEAAERKLATAVEYEIPGSPWYVRIVKSIGYPVGQNRSWYIYDSVDESYWRDGQGWAKDIPSRFTNPDDALESFKALAQIEQPQRPEHQSKENG